MKRIILTTILLLAVLCQVTAQISTEDILSQAKNAFELGNFESVDTILNTNLYRLKQQDKIEAYRLLALKSIYTDNLDEAEAYSSRLLEIDPFYSAYNDTPRLADILERLKKGKTTITTASQQEETLDEAPVPMTLITEDMLRASGALTLSDVLMLYVPGIVSIGGIEENVAMRGVYGMTQETILVMENGNRLNSHSTNAQPLDYRINLDKVKQIEVLRGPASSLYGNVALTAVVNVITKTGSDMDGAEVACHTGTYKNFGGAFTYGKGNLHSDLFSWFAVNNVQGQKVMREGRPYYVGGYNGKPTFDLGINGRWGDFKISASGKHAKPVPYNNLIGLGEYTYDNYTRLQGELPGMARTNLRFDASYSHKWDKFSVSASAFGVYERMQLYNVLGDKVPIKYAALLAVLLDPTQYVDSAQMFVGVDTVGLFQAINWEDYAFGGTVTGSYSYTIPRVNMRGSVLAGIQYEYFTQTSANFFRGIDYDSIKSVKTKDVLYDGAEHTIAAFAQLKHHFTPRLIFNGGIRYDHRIRYNRNRLDRFSPRASLIWLANDIMSIRGSYSHSFVDAPYLYRASSIDIFGGDNLKPERMDAYQLGARFDFSSLLSRRSSSTINHKPSTINPQPSTLTYECNLFLNQVRDLVYYDMQNRISFVNSGLIDMCGMEHTLQFTNSKLLVNLNLTYQYPLKAEDFATVSKHELANIPAFLGNIVAAWKFYDSSRFGKFWVRGNLHTQSAFNCSSIKLEKIIDYSYKLSDARDKYYNGEITAEEYEKVASEITTKYKRQPFTAIAGAGAEWMSTFGLGVSVDVSNICNTQYYAGGLARSATPRLGTSVIGTIRYHF